MPESSKEEHSCKGYIDSDAHGPAIDSCLEWEDGTFWVSNGEYQSQVNYCPYCGTKAPTQGRIEEGK